jgi:hypothetical protein
MKSLHIWWVALGFVVARWIFRREPVPDPVARLRSAGM